MAGESDPTTGPPTGDDAGDEPDPPTGTSAAETGEGGESIDGAGGLVPGAAPSATTTNAGGRRGRHADETSRMRWRRRLVNVLAVLTCIGALASVVAVWSHRLLLNTNAWVSTVGPLADDPRITDALATALTDEIFQLIDPEQLAKDALPDKADFLAAPLTNALHGFVDEQAKNLLQTDQFKTFWVEANRIVHENVVKLLRGEPVAGFTATNGVVTLNILPLLSKTMQWIVDKAPGVLGDKITVPQITQETPPDQARAELSAAFHVPVPPTFGVYTVFQSDDLAAAQAAVNLFDRLVYVIVIVTLALLVATIVLSRNRRRTLIGVGIGLVLAMALADALTRSVERIVLQLIGGPQARDAAEATINTLISDLRVITNVLLAAGAVVVVVAFLTGDSRLATGIRAGFLRATGRLPHRPVEVTATALPVLTRYAGGFKVGGAVVAVVLLIVTDVTVWSLIVILAALALYELFVTAVTHVADDDEPADTPAATAATAADAKGVTPA